MNKDKLKIVRAECRRLVDRIKAYEDAMAEQEDHEREVDAPAWLFAADGLEFDATVLPLDCLRQAPLSGVDGRPMRRGSARQLRELLAADEIAGHEAEALAR